MTSEERFWALKGLRPVRVPAPLADDPVSRIERWLEARMRVVERRAPTIACADCGQTGRRPHLMTCKRMAPDRRRPMSERPALVDLRAGATRRAPSTCPPFDRSRPLRITFGE
jgi:hypothetical protein